VCELDQKRIFSNFLLKSQLPFFKFFLQIFAPIVPSIPLVYHIVPNLRNRREVDKKRKRLRGVVERKFFVDWINRKISEIFLWTGSTQKKCEKK
jgi:hypothetical protein